MKRILLIALSLIPMLVSAQEHLISGIVTDADTHAAVEMATIQMLNADSTFVSGTTADNKGRFEMAAAKPGKYILRIQNIGYKKAYKDIVVAKTGDVNAGKIRLYPEAIVLKGTTVTANAAKVVLSKDTFIYNAAAYRTPDGSTIEELVKRLPGAQVDDDGKITINGKQVTKIKVDGKEFMTGDTKTAMKNLPTSIISKIKAYNEKSDLAKVTGIDDGEEQTVLDFGVKPGMNRGLMANADLSYGTKDRYAERLMGAYFNSDTRAMLFGNANNTNDMGFPGGGGRGSFGRGRNGLNAMKMVAANFNYNKKKRFEFDGNVRWNHSDNDTRTKSASENFVSSSNSFSNSLNQSYSRSDEWNAQMRLEWKPDTMTNILFRPKFSFSKSDGKSINSSAQFSENPYNYVSSPLDAESLEKLAENDALVNTNLNNSISYSESKSAGGTLQINRKLGNRGRNVTLRASMDYSEDTSKSINVSKVTLYKIKNAEGTDSTYFKNRYNVVPSKKWNYSIQATYSEPIMRATYLQFSYKFNSSFTRNRRSTYDFSQTDNDFITGITPAYRSWDEYLSTLAYPYEHYRDDALSRNSEYRNFTHNIEVMFRMIRTKMKLNAGFMVQPQNTHFVQDYLNVHTDTSRNVINVSPTLDFRYRFSKVSSLRVNYRGTTSQPSMTDLLDITDDSDPLNISKGNPGLKPSFTNNLWAEYNNYFEKRQQSVMASLNYSTTRNSIGSKVTYDEKTGGRTVRPENINGNWNMSGMLVFNTAVDTAGYWNVNTMTNIAYNNRVGYLEQTLNGGTQKNLTKSFDLNERLGFSYRNSWLEAEIDGALQYMHTNNNLQAMANLNTWQFSYGGTINVTCPWGTSISTDLHQNSRRGYSDNSMNTNELVWNAQLSQGFLRGRALTVSLQFYDILAQQSNFSRSVTSMSRSDTEYNSINSYAMVHVVYRLNLFGKRQQQRQMQGPRDGENPRMMPPPGHDGGGGFNGRPGFGRPPRM